MFHDVNTTHYTASYTGIHRILPLVPKAFIFTCIILYILLYIYIFVSDLQALQAGLKMGLDSFTSCNLIFFLSRSVNVSTAGLHHCQHHSSFNKHSSSCILLWTELLPSSSQTAGFYQRTEVHPDGAYPVFYHLLVAAQLI